VWRAAVWLLFNLGVQAVPVVYLWLHMHDEPGALWEYVNCTLLVLIATAMLFAVVSDLLTEKARPFGFGWLSIVLIIGVLLAFLHRSLHDEVVSGLKPDKELLIGSAILGLCIVAVSTFLKMGIWYMQLDREDK
jgi:hypothetical protein